MGERPIEPNCFETDREEQWHDVGYFDGYNDAKKNAYEWLKEHADEYYMSSMQADDCYYDSDKMLEGFLKVMEK